MTRVIPGARGALMLLAVLLAVVAALVAPSRSAHAFTSYPCHDDTSISRANTHGSPLNGTFGDQGQPPNHSHGYYYLDITTAGCTVGADGHYHLLGRVTANGIGLLAGHPTCDITAWFPSTSGVDNPTCDPKWRAITGTALASEDPTWGFEMKLASNGSIIACAGGNGAGGTDCSGTPNVTASPGTATVEFRFDLAAANTAYRFRIANEYVNDSGLTDVMWETASFDVVACSTCEP